jgi:N-acetylneuraminic acid mutarotase
MNDICRFDTEKSAWVPEDAQGSPPPARSFHAMCSDMKRYIYVFGGCGEGGRLNDLFVYDTQYRKWQQLPSSDGVVVIPQAPAKTVGGKEKIVLFVFMFQ